MQIRVNKLIVLISCVLLIRCIVFVGLLYLNHDIGVPNSRLEADIRSGQHISPDWTVEGTASNTMAAFISYPDDMTHYVSSVYVNRPGLSFGYFFRGSLAGSDTSIREYIVEGYKLKF